MSQYVRAYHLIMTAYGFWLPNDPRGSWSDFVRSWELQRFGLATRTLERRSVARNSHDVALRLAAKRSIARPAVRFSGIQARAIARGFARKTASAGYIVHACSILPTHVHMVIARHQYSIEKIATLLKGAATSQLLKEGLHPFANDPYANGLIPTPWTRRYWSVFLGDDAQIRRAIAYVQRNPIKEGYRAQHWNFITPFDA